MDPQRSWEPTESSRRLRRRRGKDTKPELLLRRTLHAASLRYRVEYRALGRTRIDIAFTRLRLAVFVDGCFWHGCPIHGRTSFRGPNQELWKLKLARNKERDARVSVQLQELGWTVVRLWECDILRDPDATLESLVQILGQCNLRPKSQGACVSVPAAT
jgi:DNA mismatch endonuclease (patch repair protein)